MRVVPLLLAASCVAFSQSPVREVETGAVVSSALPGLANNHLYFIDMPDHIRVFSPNGYSSIVIDLDGRGDERAYQRKCSGKVADRRQGVCARDAGLRWQCIRHAD